MLIVNKILFVFFFAFYASPLVFQRIFSISAQKTSSFYAEFLFFSLVRYMFAFFLRLCPYGVLPANSKRKTLFSPLKSAF